MPVFYPPSATNGLDDTTWREFYIARGKENLGLDAEEISHYWDDFHWSPNPAVV